MNISLHTVRAAAFITACMLPSTAVAYLSPEQVFGGEAPAIDASAGTHAAASSATSDRSAAERVGYTPPPTARESADTVAARQQQAQAARQAAQQSLVPTYAEPEDTFVPASQPAVDRTTDEAMYNLRMQRLSEQGQRGNSVVIIGPDGQPVVIDAATGRVLRSGAPLVADTGLGTVLGVLLALFAAGTTIFLSTKERTSR